MWLKASMRRGTTAWALSAAIALAATTAVPAPAAPPCAYDVQIIVPDIDCGFGFVPPTHGRAINDAGAVTGFLPPCFPGTYFNYLWTPERGFDLIPNLPGMSYPTPDGINSAMQIIGNANMPSGARAYILQDGQVTLIQPPSGGLWTYASGINDAGVVVGQAPNPLTRHAEAFSWQRGVLTLLGTYGGESSFAT